MLLLERLSLFEYLKVINNDYLDLGGCFRFALQHFLIVIISYQILATVNQSFRWDENLPHPWWDLCLYLFIRDLSYFLMKFMLLITKTRID